MKVRPSKKVLSLNDTRLPEKHYPGDAVWIRGKLIGLSEEFIDDVLTQYSATYENKGRQAANQLVLSLPVQQQVYREKHTKLAYHAQLLMVLYGLNHVADWAGAQGAIVPPFSRKQSSADYQPIGTAENPQQNGLNRTLSADYYRNRAAKRLMDAEWWELQLNKLIQRDTEARRHKNGGICKGLSPYVSEEAKDRYVENQQTQDAWKKNCFLISDEGDEISLDSSEHEHSAAYIQFAEYVTRCKGLEAMAEEHYVADEVLTALPESITFKEGGSFHDLDKLAGLNHIDGLLGVAITLTVPSRFHRYRYDKATGKFHLNKKYDPETTPRAARDWLQETWELTQKAWQRKTKNIRPIPCFGYRVLEAHGDGTPHYHFAFWVPAKDMQRAVALFMNKALRGDYTDRVKQQDKCQFGKAGDATENGALKRRVNFKIMVKKGGMMAYMMKYISKGITGADFEDLKSGMMADDALLRILAHRSVWGLRQFSFYGAAPMGVYREARRLPDEPQQDQTIEKIRLAAQAGDYKAYTEANGGMFCKRDDRPLKVHKVDRDAYNEGEWLDDAGQCRNRYGDIVRQVKGLILNDETIVETRLKRWSLLNTAALNVLLIQKHIRESGTPKHALPVTFSADIQSVIDRAKAEKKLSRLADRAGIVLFPEACASECSAAERLGLVGITFHEEKTEVTEHSDIDNPIGQNMPKIPINSRPPTQSGLEVQQ
ncbi:MAG: replication endonuclease [Thiolinea sp.]